MFARISIATFQNGAMDEALDIFQRRMLPSASMQNGFRGAFVSRDSQKNCATIITMWETEADMLASGPPLEIVKDVERFGALIAEVTQEHQEVILQIIK